MPAASFGDRAVVITEVEHPHRHQSVLAALFPDAIVRVGLDALLIEFDAPRSDLGALCAAAEVAMGLAVLEPAMVTERIHEVELRYDGPDLASAADLLGIETATLIERHQLTRWRVAMIGFAPGFPYLTPEIVTSGDDFQWELPRRTTPRPRVPAGSVAIAAGMSAIYPTAMPGGWHLIGTTTLRLFDPERVPATLFHINDLITFKAIG